MIEVYFNTLLQLFTMDFKQGEIDNKQVIQLLNSSFIVDLFLIFEFDRWIVK